MHVYPDMHQMIRIAGLPDHFPMEGATAPRDDDRNHSFWPMGV
jgi:hypothetical protein